MDRYLRNMWQGQLGFTRMDGVLLGLLAAGVVAIAYYAPRQDSLLYTRDMQNAAKSGTGIPSGYSPGSFSDIPSSGSTAESDSSGAHVSS